MEEQNSTESKPNKTVITVLAAGILILGLSTGFLWNKVNELAQLQSQSPIVIVDFMQVTSSYPANASEPELEELMAKVSKAIKDLGEAGYIVLDSASVLSAPDEAILHDLYELATQE